MAHKIKLTKSELVNVNYQWITAFRLRVDASDPDNVGTDTAVFLWQRNLTNPYNGEIVDIFLGVASVLDMSVYSVGGPSTENTYPLFRLDYVEIDLPSVTLGDQAWAIIQQQVTTLLKMLEVMETKLKPVEEVLIGEVPTSDSSSSSDSA